MTLMVEVLTCKVNALVDMFDPVVGPEDDRVVVAVCLDTQGAVHVGDLVGTRRLQTLHRVIVVLCSLDTNTRMGL